MKHRRNEGSLIWEIGRIVEHGRIRLAEAVTWVAYWILPDGAMFTLHWRGRPIRVCMSKFDVDRFGPSLKSPEGNGDETK